MCLYLQSFILWYLLRIICYNLLLFFYYSHFCCVQAIISYSLCSIKMSIILIILCFKLLLHSFQVVLESIIRIIAIIVLLHRLFYLYHSHYLCRFFVDLIFFSPFHLIHYGYYWSIIFFILGFYYLRANFLG